MSGEGASGPPLSAVLAIIILKERKELEKGVPEGTPNVWSVSKAAPRGARSKWSATSVSSVLNAAGPSTPEANDSRSWAKRSSTRRCGVCVSSRLGTIEAFVSLRSGACQPETHMGDLMKTEPDGSDTSNIPDKASHIDWTRSCVAAVLSVWA